MFKRRKTRVVNAGGALIGGDNPISVQTMTKTHTEVWALLKGRLISLLLQTYILGITWHWKPLRRVLIKSGLIRGI